MVDNKKNKEKKMKRNEILVTVLLTAIVLFAVIGGSLWIISQVSTQPEVVFVPVGQQPQAVVHEQPVIVPAEQKPQAVVNQQPHKTYFPEYSCSDLTSCTVKQVPDGLMTIGFIRINRNMPNHNCGYAIFTSGQAINYDGLSEIHTYSGNLPDPATTLESFVESNMPFVHACN